MDFDRLLLNWAHWARNREIIPVSCRSLESHYKPPPIWHYPEPKFEPDVKDALLVESILVSPTFPRSSKDVIVYAHVYPWWRLEGALRKINKNHPNGGIKEHNFNKFLKDAETMLKNRLMHASKETCNNNQNMVDYAQQSDYQLIAVGAK